MEWISGLGRPRRSRRGGSPPRVAEILERRTLLADGIAPQGAAPLMGAPGVPLNNVAVATFTITDPSGSPGTKWNAQITWGDGQTSKRVAATAGPNGTFQFVGTHTYATANTYTITVMIAVPGSHKPNDNVVTTQAIIRVAATLQSIAVAPANPTLPVGTTQQFTATGTFSDGSTQDLTSQVTWASSNTTVATISASGVASALAQGTSTLSATLGGVTGSTGLTVNTAALQSIAVTPANPALSLGGTQQFTATGTFSDGSTGDLTSRVTWASSDAGVATISATGLATAAAPGTSSITAALGAVAGSTTLRVNPPPPPPFPIAGLHYQAKLRKTSKHFVAYFREPGTKTQDFLAVINWGDGSKPSRGHIHGEGYGHYAVVGSHLYLKAGVYKVAVVVHDPKGRKATTSSLVNVHL